MPAACVSLPLTVSRFQHHEGLGYCQDTGDISLTIFLLRRSHHVTHWILVWTYATFYSTMTTTTTSSTTQTLQMHDVILVLKDMNAVAGPTGK